MTSTNDDTKAPPFEPSQVTAINLLLEPDSTMLERAAANNARLLEVFPQGFELDATHRPHITLLQRFVRTSDLDRKSTRLCQKTPARRLHRAPRGLPCERNAEAA